MKIEKNRLFVFGDSFSHPVVRDERKLPYCDFNHIHKNFVTFYHYVSMYLKSHCYNFSLSGSSPEYSMRQFSKAQKKYKFQKNDYVIFLLSDPCRDFADFSLETEENNPYGYENIRNITYLHYLSKYVYPDVKFFINVIWKDTTYYLHVPTTYYTDKNFYHLNDTHDNFYLCDCELGVIHAKEFKNYDIIEKNDETGCYYDYKRDVRFDDIRVNHMSQCTHDTFAEIILSFFLHNEKPTDTDKLFKIGFLDESDEYLIKVSHKGFIYE